MFFSHESTTQDRSTSTSTKTFMRLSFKWILSLPEVHQSFHLTLTSVHCEILKHYADDYKWLQPSMKKPIIPLQLRQRRDKLKKQYYQYTKSNQTTHLLVCMLVNNNLFCNISIFCFFIQLLSHNHRYITMKCLKKRIKGNHFNSCPGKNMSRITSTRS